MGLRINSQTVEDGRRSNTSTRALPNTRDSVPYTTSARPCNYAHFVLEEQRQLVQEQGVIQPLRRHRWDRTYMHWMLGYAMLSFVNSFHQWCFVLTKNTALYSIGITLSTVSAA